MSRPANRAKTHFLKNDDLSSILEPAEPSETALTATKVIITIGPACQDVDTLCKLLETGVSCARCDLTWGPLDFHRQSLANLQKAMHKTRKLCAIMLDTIGRELLIDRESKLDANGWPIHQQVLSVKCGDKITITTKQTAEDCQDSNLLPISYPKFPTMCSKGDTIFLGRYLVTGSEDSSLYLTVEEVTATDVVCVARNDSQLDGLLTVFHTERSADGLSNLQNDLPILCAEDKAAIKSLASEFELDFISLSFTREAKDVEQAREFLTANNLLNTKVLAKCETRQSLFEFHNIAELADGMVMSRGNLGLDVLPEKMALIQKAIISNCNLMGKPVFVTRVVDTMISNPRPTRAEATDVANAVLDGVDGILLGAETLRGKHPVATVETILHICKQAEKVFDHQHHFEHLLSEAFDLEKLNPEGVSPSASNNNLARASGSLGSGNLGSDSALGHVSLGANNPYLMKLESIASSAVRCADKVAAKLIIVYTTSGTTARLVSKYRPPMPIVTLVVPVLKCVDGQSWRLEGKSNARQCLVHRGLLPVLAAPSPSGETLLAEAVQMSVRSGLVRPNDHIVVVQKAGDHFMVKIISVDPDGGGIASIRPQSLVDMMKNAHAAAGGPVDEESQAHIEEQIKRQLAGKPDPVPPGFAPRNSFSPKDIPATLGDPQLSGSLAPQVQQDTSLQKDSMQSRAAQGLPSNPESTRILSMVQAGDTGREGGRQEAGYASSATGQVRKDDIGGASVACSKGPLMNVSDAPWEHSSFEGPQQDVATSKGQEGPQGSSSVVGQGADAGGTGSLGIQAGLHMRRQLLDKAGAGESQAGSDVKPGGSVQAAPNEHEAGQPLVAARGGQGTATQMVSKMRSGSSSSVVPGKASKKGLLQRLLGRTN